MIVAVASSLRVVYLFLGSERLQFCLRQGEEYLFEHFKYDLQFFRYTSGIRLHHSFGKCRCADGFAKNHGIDFISSFSIYSIGGLMLCYVYFQVPLATLLLIPSFEGLRKKSGANRLACLAAVTPLIGLGWLAKLASGNYGDIQRPLRKRHCCFPQQDMR